MVFGLIDFLLGGRKKTKIPQNAQAASPTNNIVNPVNLNGDEKLTQNPTTGIELSNNNENNQQSQNANITNQNGNQTQNQFGSNNSEGKKTISMIFNKIHTEIKELNTNVSNLATDIKEVRENISSLDHRVSEIESKNKFTDEKLSDMDNNMSKFLSLYELVNNQYNPFVSQEKPAIKQVTVNADGTSETELSNKRIEEGKEEGIKNLDLSNYKPQEENAFNDLKSSLLELDTLNIEDAAGDSVPLTHIKHNTNSLVTILSWLEYLVKKVGLEGTKNTLQYYTETVKWITPEVYFDLEKFLRGMDDIENENKNTTLNVKDHIVSLYFISKLNEKTLDNKLTKAVLQIIKEN